MGIGSSLYAALGCPWTRARRGDWIEYTGIREVDRKEIPRIEGVEG